MTSSLRRSGNQPKGRGRNVTWNAKVARLWHLVAEHGDAAISVQRCSNQKIIKHHLHMTPSRYWVDNEYHARNRPGSAAVAALRDLPRQYSHPSDEVARRLAPSGVLTTRHPRQ